MPCINCELVDKISEVAKLYCQVNVVSEKAYIGDVVAYLKENKSDNSPVVICGSLYLYADVVK